VRLMGDALGDEMESRSFSALGNLDGARFESLIVGGGTLLDCRASPWMRTLFELSVMSGRTVLAGTGMDPGEPWTGKGREILTKLLEATRQGERLVRGPISAAMLKAATGIDCELGLDPMALYEPAAQPRRGEKVLIVPGYQAKTVAANLYHERMMDAARKLREVKWQVGFLPVWRRDISLALLYSHEVEGSELVSNGTGFEQIVAAMGEAHVVITDRLHAGLLALILGRPALFMAHHIKTVDLCLALAWPHYAVPRGDDWQFEVMNFAEHPPTIPVPQLERFQKRFQKLIWGLKRG